MYCWLLYLFPLIRWLLPKLRWWMVVPTSRSLSRSCNPSWPAVLQLSTGLRISHQNQPSLRNYYLNSTTMKLRLITTSSTPFPLHPLMHRRSESHHWDFNHYGTRSKHRYTACHFPIPDHRDFDCLTFNGADSLFIHPGESANVASEHDFITIIADRPQKKSSICRTQE